jgi:hypothetical protein
MTTVTRNCDYCNEPFKPVRDHQRFCSTRHRVYANRYGAEYGHTVSASAPANGQPADHSIGAALAAARDGCPVHIAETKTVAAIRIERPGPDPNHWIAHVPPNSSGAAGKIHGDLINQIGDLIALANKLGAANGEPLYSLRTKPRPKR